MLFHLDFSWVLLKEIWKGLVLFGEPRLFHLRKITQMQGKKCDVLNLVLQRRDLCTGEETRHCWEVCLECWMRNLTLTGYKEQGVLRDRCRLCQSPCLNSTGWLKWERWGLLLQLSHGFLVGHQNLSCSPHSQQGSLLCRRKVSSQRQNLYSAPRQNCISALLVGTLWILSRAKVRHAKSSILGSLYSSKRVFKFWMLLTMQWAVFVIFPCVIQAVTQCSRLVLTCFLSDACSSQWLCILAMFLINFNECAASHMFTMKQND